jgi:uncharacterized cupin superfamily protein
MERKPARLLRAANIVEKRRWFSQRLNPSSRFRVSSLGEAGGLERVGVSIAWLPPGKESFAFHAHRYEEEWPYVLEGCGLSIMGDEEALIGAGDFVAFPAPSVAHVLRNTGDRDLVYLMGGENLPVEVIDSPRLGKAYMLLSRRASGQPRTAFYELPEAEFPFGPAEPDGS